MDLFEFNVILFGLNNTPIIFQWIDGWNSGENRLVSGSNYLNDLMI
jgi:hypothetical protein